MLPNQTLGFKDGRALSSLTVENEEVNPSLLEVTVAINKADQKTVACQISSTSGISE
jgi:hypothetical protein